MQKHPVVVAGVVYPGVEGFVSNFVSSLSTQTFRDFDLLIINDGAEEVLKSLFPQETIWVNLEDRMTIAEIRRFLIDHAQARYSQLIFADTDDFFSANRVEESLKWLTKFDFVFNEVSLVDCEGQVLHSNYFSSLDVEDEIADFSLLEDRNVIGLSNSAINLQALPDLCIPPDLIAVDWWIYTVLLINGCKGKFIKDAVSFYRQHGSNTIGMQACLTEKKLELGLSVKMAHYNNLASYCVANNHVALAERFLEKVNETSAVEVLTRDKVLCERYLDKVNRNYSSINSGWWSEIISVDRFNQYE
ncbi:hypothetical protein [Geobacter sp.]|uniref:hypothetical protein n=1 Tax=Geobacter sp. TaxID=46610 RepID=UPI0027B8E276|nr:hypothetical protein [Geobacter sp.]